MDAATIEALGKAGGAAALGLAAVGSSIGAGLAGSSAIGAWKKCYAQSKAAPFIGGSWWVGGEGMGRRGGERHKHSRRALRTWGKGAP